MSRHADAEEKKKPVTMTAEDMVRRLRAGVNETFAISMRGVDIPVRVLSIEEVRAIRRDAIVQTMLSKGDETDQNVMVQKNTLALASQLGKGGAQMLTPKVLDMLTLDEVGYLFDEYIAVLDQVNPSIDHISEDRFKAIVDALKKKAVTVKELSLRERNAICEAYVALILTQESQT